MKKFLVCLLALTFVFAFAACKGEDKPVSGETATGAEVFTTAPDIPETTAADKSTTVSETVAEAESATSDDTAATTQPDEETSQVAGIPTDTAGILRYYNEALAKTPMQRTSYTRTMTKITGFAKALGLTILDEPDLQDNGDVKPFANLEEKTIRPSDLVALEAGWVTGAQSSMKGNEATLTITMKNHPLDPSLDPKPGTRGYVSTLDRATVEPLVSDISMKLAAAVISPNALKKVDVTNSSYAMSDGKYTVVIDTVTGKIKSLTFTGSQYVEGNAKCVLNIPLIPASANAFVTLKGNLVAIYAPK